MDIQYNFPISRYPDAIHNRHRLVVVSKAIMNTASTYTEVVNRWRERCIAPGTPYSNRCPEREEEPNSDIEILANLLATWDMSVNAFKRAMQLHCHQDAPKEVVTHFGNLAKSNGKTLIHYLNEHNIAIKRVDGNDQENTPYDVSAVTEWIESEVRSMSITEEQSEAFAKETGIDKLLAECL